VSRGIASSLHTAVAQLAEIVTLERGIFRQLLTIKLMEGADMARFNAMEEDFEEVTILDKPALFTPIRIDRNSVPRGYHMYEVRHDDDCSGIACQIARNIVVNHWGTLITRDKIKMPPDGYLDLELYDLNYSTGECGSMKEFMAKYPPRIKPPKSHER
jgi:hypothetical protein